MNWKGLEWSGEDLLRGIIPASMLRPGLPCCLHRLHIAKFSVFALIFSAPISPKIKINDVTNVNGKSKSCEDRKKNDGSLKEKVLHT
jgi:hypothetical protein